MNTPLEALGNEFLTSVDDIHGSLSSFIVCIKVASATLTRL